MNLFRRHFSSLLPKVGPCVEGNSTELCSVSVFAELCCGLSVSSSKVNPVAACMAVWGAQWVYPADASHLDRAKEESYWSP